MYYLRWHFTEQPLPTCSVYYEQEPYLSVSEQNEEKLTVERLRESCGVFNQFVEDINKNGFPDLCPINWKHPTKEYPLHYFAPQKELGTIKIECDKIVGGNWANMPPGMRGNYPKPRKFWNLLAGYLNLNDTIHNTRDKIPAIPVYKIMDDYFCDEGNHRLYVSRILGFKTIKAEVVEIDYYTFLKNSYVYKDTVFSERYIAYPDNRTGRIQLYEIDEDEIQQYQKLKEQLQMNK